MILWLVLFTSSVFAQEGSFEEFCFSNSTQMKIVSMKLRPILLPVDTLSVSQNCFSIQTPEHRRELIQSYVKRLDSSVSIKFSSAEIRREPCKLKVERFILNKDDQTVFNASEIIQAQKDEAKNAANETMQIQTLDKFELAFNQSIIKGQCKYITPDRYEITLEARKDPKPVTTPSPQVEQTSAIKTQVQLSRGEKIEVGSIVNSSDNKEHTFSTTPQLGTVNDKKFKSERLYLSLE